MVRVLYEETDTGRVVEILEMHPFFGFDDHGIGIRVLQAPYVVVKVTNGINVDWIDGWGGGRNGDRAWCLFEPRTPIRWYEGTATDRIRYEYRDRRVCAWKIHEEQIM